jgi:nucleoside-diphosphate-sugar epimerase
MPSYKKVAAVTGARGLVGSEIVNRLLEEGWVVKVLTRSSAYYDNIKVRTIVSDINNMEGLHSLLHKADAVFHCAGEINDKKRMYLTNVEGTRNLLKAIKKSNVSYFCHISSAGVVGANTTTSTYVINEKTNCNPIGLYEKTKRESEKLVLAANLKINVIILRPTNVFNNDKLGVFISLPIINSWREKLKVFITGKECAHIVDVKNVAEAALFFLGGEDKGVNTYFISSDDDKINTVLDIYNFYAFMHKRRRLSVSAPTFIPNIMRKLYRGSSLHGKIHFSSDKIKKKGFVFKAIEGSLRKIYTEINR